MNTKEQEQIKALVAWKANNYCGTIEAATGFGKTRCGVFAAKRCVELNPNAKILIVTPTTDIRDNTWKAEFIKWKCLKVYSNNVTIECINTVYKWENTFYDLIILDELHNYIPNSTKQNYEFFKFFENNKWEWILGLSATIDVKQRDRLNTICPTVYYLSLERAKTLSLVSDFVLYNVPLNLNSEERNVYENQDKILNKFMPVFQWNIEIMYKCMKESFYTNYLNFHKIDTSNGMILKAPFICNVAINKRKTLLYNASEKLEVTSVLKDKYFSLKKGLVFGQTVDFANKVEKIIGNSCRAYHSKLTKKSREVILKSFEDKRTKLNLLATASALNEGVNLSNIEYAIIAASTSQSRILVQRIGRAIRKEGEKIPIIIRLYIKDSQEEKWVEKSMKSGISAIWLKDKAELYEILK